MFRSGHRHTADMGSGDEQQAWLDRNNLYLAWCIMFKLQGMQQFLSSNPILAAAFKMWIHGFCRTCLFFLGLQESWSLSGSYHSLLAIQVSLWRHLVYFFHMLNLQIKWLSGVFLSWYLWLSRQLKTFLKGISTSKAKVEINISYPATDPLPHMCKF